MTSRQLFQLRASVPDYENRVAGRGEWLNGLGRPYCLMLVHSGSSAMGVDIWGLSHQEGFTWNRLLGWGWWDYGRHSISGHIEPHTLPSVGPRQGVTSSEGFLQQADFTTDQKQAAFREAPSRMSRPVLTEGQEAGFSIVVGTGTWACWGPGVGCRAKGSAGGSVELLERHAQLLEG